MPDESLQAHKLSKEQKIGFILLSVFAFFAIGLGFLQIRNTMYGPFSLTRAVPSTLNEEINSPESLHYRDTDLDGINDFDELYVYSTSPYLADTDSDGIDDKTEIDQGKNPNCAEGKDCAMPILNASESTNVVVGTSSISTPDPGVAPADLSATLSDPKQIRKLLRDSGIDEKTLAGFSDSELITAVGEFMTSTAPMLQQINNNFNAGAANAIASTTGASGLR